MFKGGGCNLIFSYICRVIFWVRNFKFQYFWGFFFRKNGGTDHPTTSFNYDVYDHHTNLWSFLWVEVVLIEAFIEIEGFWPLGTNGP